jgi:hypothetical protein
MDLFTPQVPAARQHQVFKMLLQDLHGPERAVLTNWAAGFSDRDGKFVQEFQTTFESAFWELYLNAALRCLDLKPDMSVPSPDFVISSPLRFSIEATIAAPPEGGAAPIGYNVPDDIPADFTEFNIGASIRISNSFSGKLRRYREYYAKLPHVAGHPFVIAIAAFDRPLSHFAAGRPLFVAIYGLYHDEAVTAPNADKVVSYKVSAAPKNMTAEVPMGLFCDDSYADVSAVIYSSLVTWGKVRALADNPTARTIYTTFHPQAGTLKPTVRREIKRDYSEHLLDGLYVLHNPFAARPIPHGVLSHPRLAEVRVAFDGELQIKAPDDFLLVRTLQSFREKEERGT